MCTRPKCKTATHLQQPMDDAAATQRLHEAVKQTLSLQGTTPHAVVCTPQQQAPRVSMHIYHKRCFAVLVIVYINLQRRHTSIHPTQRSACVNLHPSNSGTACGACWHLPKLCWCARLDSRASAVAATQREQPVPVKLATATDLIDGCCSSIG
jgi:hypothetical protein